MLCPLHRGRKPPLFFLAPYLGVWFFSLRQRRLCTSCAIGVRVEFRRSCSTERVQTERRGYPLSIGRRRLSCFGLSTRAAVPIPSLEHQQEPSVRITANNHHAPRTAIVTSSKRGRRRGVIVPLAGAMTFALLAGCVTSGSVDPGPATGTGEGGGPSGSTGTGGSNANPNATGGSTVPAGSGGSAVPSATGGSGAPVNTGGSGAAPSSTGKGIGK